jgi:phospholipid transport system transporter-binding protein
MPAISLNAENEICLSGHLNFHTARHILEKSFDLFPTTDKIIVDFSKVKSVNTAALVLITQWMKIAKKENKSLVFRHLPDHLIAIARLSGLEEIVRNE